LQRIILKGSEHRPLVFAIEDLHWMDKSSEDAAKYLMESIPGARVLMIFTYRPEFVHTWGGKSFHSQITLNRLSNRESLAMLADLLGTGDIALDLQELILEKTEGVPFFIEELVRALRDMEIIQRTKETYHLAKDIDRVAIPSTIQDVIMARVDSLPDAAKEVLQAGSVIEREFSYELIKEVMGFSEQMLLSHLSVLKDAELLYERGIFPQSTFIFKHALTREVVYDSILASRKKKLRELVGNAIEQLFKENIEEHCAALADHYLECENFEKSAYYSDMAGRKALKTGSLQDAVAYTQRSIDCLEKLPATEDILTRIMDTRTKLGLSMLQMNYFFQMKAAIDPIIDSAIARGNKKRLSQIYAIIGVRAYLVEEDFPRAFKYLEESLRLSEEVQDAVSLFQSNWWLGLAYALECQFEKALHFCENALKFNIARNILWGISVTKSNMGFLIHYYEGRLNLAHQKTDEALQMAEEIGDIFTRSSAYVNYGISCYGKRLLEEATECLLRGLDCCERGNNHVWNAFAHQFLGEIYSETGKYQKSKDHYERAVWVLEHQVKSPSWINLSKMGLAKAKMMVNARDIDLNLLYGYVTGSRQETYRGWLRRHLAEILLHMDDQHFPEAQHWIEEAIEADEKNRMRFHLGRDYSVYAELFKRTGDRAAAREQLGKAIDIYIECGADGWVKKAEEQLARLS
jgi:predicted ATPase